MTKTYAELQRLATDCMESNNPNVVERHRGAAARARDLAEAVERFGRDHFSRELEARALLEAVAIHETEAGEQLTTAELLLAAAMIAARAQLEELPAPCNTADEPDLRADMESTYEEEKARGRELLEWLMTEEKLAELAEALGYEDGDKPSEALGLRIRISPGVASIGGWALHSAAARGEQLTEARADPLREIALQLEARA